MRRISFVLLACMPVLAGCGPGGSAGATPGPSPGPSASPTAAAPIDYNARGGSNRAAASAALAVARLLYADHAYWEVYVKTTPQVLPIRVDPTDPGSVVRASSGVTSVDMVTATEASNAILNFRNAGHDHEREVLLSAMELLQRDFPNTQRLTVAVFYGESHQHASGTYASGNFDYKFLDKL
ncbi:MAG: hypothetical protein ACYDGR_02175 [Candidatus Dormibacteria bacterium]